MRRALLPAAVALVCAATAAAGSSPVDFGVPAPARAATARLAVSTGSGAERFSLWTAANRTGEICLGWTLGASARPPRSYQCLRRGLERPVLWAEGGGGLGGQTTWGAVAGVAGPQVTRVAVTEGISAQTQRDLTLVPLLTFPGWRVFTTGVEGRPPNLVDAYGRQGQLLRDTGIRIHPPGSALLAGTVTTPTGVVPVITVPGPPVNGQLPPARGPSWTDTYARLGADPAAERGIETALALPSVRNVLAHHPAWLEQTTSWSTCSGRSLGYVLSFRFRSPASFTAVLPMIGSAAGTAYTTSTEKIRAGAWRELNVSVDMNSGTVAGIDAHSYAALPLGEGTTDVVQTLTPPRSGGGSDTSCSHD